VLHSTLEEEKAADQTPTDIAKNIVNPDATPGLERPRTMA
jgi:ferritin-like metal-binding protein YciE